VSNLTFPVLQGLVWEFTMVPLFNVLVQTAVSGYEVRSQLQSVERWELTLSYSILRDNPNVVDENSYTELKKLVGFYLAMGGAFDDFLINLTDLTKNQSDSLATGAIIGTGDGATKKFQLTRPYGQYNQVIQNPSNQFAQVYVNGVAKTFNTDYAIANGVVTFTVAPSLGALVTADFIALFRVRFNTGESAAVRSGKATDLEVKNFMYQLWSCATVDLVTVKTR
jgi:uncharacterized protein (TIGR02217 family)